jgi:hypothetical protein
MHAVPRNVSLLERSGNHGGLLARKSLKVEEH